MLALVVGGAIAGLLGDPRPADHRAADVFRTSSTVSTIPPKTPDEAVAIIQASLVVVDAAKEEAPSAGASAQGAT